MTHYSPLKFYAYEKSSISFLSGIHLRSESINRVEVFNMAGQRVWDGQYSENEITIATGNWAPGTYMVKVTAQGTAKVEKVLVR